MKRATREWVKKAEEDYLSALDLARRRKVPLHNSVCFHCEQCAEKYLEARMEEAGLHIPKTHDLEALLNVLLPAEPLGRRFVRRCKTSPTSAWTSAIPATRQPNRMRRPLCATAKQSGQQHALHWDCLS